MCYSKTNLKKTFSINFYQSKEFKLNILQFIQTKIEIKQIKNILKTNKNKLNSN